MKPKKILCDIVTNLTDERITHIDEINKKFSGRDLFKICENFSLLTMQHFYNRDLRVTRLLYFIFGVIATFLFNLIF